MATSLARKQPSESRNLNSPVSKTSTEPGGHDAIAKSRSPFMTLKVSRKLLLHKLTRVYAMRRTLASMVEMISILTRVLVLMVVIEIEAKSVMMIASIA